MSGYFSNLQINRQKFSLILSLLIVSAIIPLRAENKSAKQNRFALWKSVRSPIGKVNIRNNGIVDFISPGRTWWLRCMTQIISKDRGTVSLGDVKFWHELDRKIQNGKLIISGCTEKTDSAISVEKTSSGEYTCTWKSKVAAIDPMISRIQFTLLLIPQIKKQNKQFLQVETVDGKKYKLSLKNKNSSIENVCKLYLPSPKNNVTVSISDTKQFKTTLSILDTNRILYLIRTVKPIEAESKILFSLQIR